MTNGSLLHRKASRSVAIVTARRSRSVLVATMLAFLAVLGMAALSGWHSSTFHHDDAVPAVAVEHVHGDVFNGDSDDAVHVAAHAIGQGIAIPAHIDATRLTVEFAASWAIGETVIGQGFEPSSLLRPPRR